MTNIGILENKISTVKKYLNLVEKYADIDLETLNKNFEKKGSLERYLYLMTQATIDLCEMIISHKKLRKPSSYSEGFEILREHYYISNDLCLKLIEMTGFRNTLAHGYEKVDNERLVETAKNGKLDIIEFVNITEKILI